MSRMSNNVAFRSSGRPTSRRRWLSAAGLLLAPLASLLLLGAVLSTDARLRADDEPSQAAKPTTVHLTIDYGDGVEKQFTGLAWKAEMTVFDVLVAAKQHLRGIHFEHRGSGETAFVTQIDDLKNEGAGRNWTYQLNGKRPSVGSGVQKVQAGDRILWKFAASR